MPSTAILTHGGRPADPLNTALEPLFSFKVLLNRVEYWAQITSQPHPGCVKTTGWAPMSYTALQDRQFVGPTLRGDTYADNVPPEPIFCRGTYRVSVSVITAKGHLYQPFGSATFVVR